MHTPPLCGQDTPVTKDDALRTLNTELLAGEGPDVLILDDTDLESFTASGLLADLSGAVDAGALLDCIAEDYVADDGAIPVLPGRFTIPVMAGEAGSLDGVATLDDVLALNPKISRAAGRGFFRSAAGQRAVRARLLGSV